MFAQMMLIGRLTKDPVEFRTQTGSSVAKFSLACTTTYSTDGENTCYINLTAFGTTGDVIIKYCKKGDLIFINCYPQNHKYTTKNGEVKNNLDFIVKKVCFLNTKAGKQAPQMPHEPMILASEVEPSGIDDIPDSELPF